MSERKKKLIHMFYGIYLAVFIVSAAFHLILGCYAIYDGANAQYSRELVAVQFSKIALPVILSIIGIIGGIVLNLALPIDGEMNLFGKKKKINYEMLRDGLAKKVDIDAVNPAMAIEIRRERRVRLISRYVCIGLCVISAIPLILSICDPHSYDKYLINESIIPAVVFTLIWCVLAFIYALALNIINRISIKAEINMLKDILAASEDSIAPQPVLSDDKAQKIVLWSIRGTILLFAVIFIIIGIVNGGMADVLGKAIRLCTECIGLG